MRKSLGILTAILVMVVFAAQVSAERRRRGNPEPAEPGIPRSDQIVSAMDDVDWGWSQKQLISHFTKELRRLYRPLLAKSTDAIAEDRLRRQMNARVARIKNSAVTFEGQHTGWDTSLIRDEYTHNNNESLVEVRELRAGGHDPRYTDYYFFINDHLWRRYRAFNQDQFSGIPFETAAASFQKRFGPAREKRRGGALVGLEWQDDTTRLEAIDNTEFFGVFCLVFSEKATESRLDQLRKNKSGRGNRLNPLVEALEDANTGSGDRHRNVVEHITGKRYNTAKNRPGDEDDSRRRPAKRSKQPAKSSGTVFDSPSQPSKSSGDPLQDLEI